MYAMRPHENTVPPRWPHLRAVLCAKQRMNDFYRCDLETMTWAQIPGIGEVPNVTHTADVEGVLWTHERLLLLCDESRRDEHRPSPARAREK